jgi:hypothetical protein
LTVSNQMKTQHTESAKQLEVARTIHSQKSANI